MTVRQTTLENGLRIVSHTMDAVETVSVGVFVDAGTRDEPVEINGVAHLLEHMAFKGTKRRSALDIVAEGADRQPGHYPEPTRPTPRSEFGAKSGNGNPMREALIARGQARLTDEYKALMAEIVERGK